MLEKPNDIRAAIGALLRVQQHAAGGRDRADHRQVILAQRRAQDRGLPLRRIGVHDERQEVEARLVYPDDGALFLLGLFLITGHRSVRQAAMAFSSRWLARRIGFCTLPPIARRSWRTSVSRGGT